MELDIEYPPEGAVVGSSACGVFVAGRALAMRGMLQKFDVAIVIDTSASTSGPAEADINGNGTIGKVYGGAFGSVFGAGLTDPGDSILAAEVAAARQLLRGLDTRSTRGRSRVSGEWSAGRDRAGTPQQDRINAAAAPNEYGQSSGTSTGIARDQRHTHIPPDRPGRSS